MGTKRTLSTLAVVIAAVLVPGAASAASAPGHASLLIRHQVRGCHTWSVNGGPFRAGQAISLQRGGWVAITNNDVMPHQLVRTSGPAAQIKNLKTSMMGMGLKGHFGPGMMAHMGAITKVSFPTAGVYVFTTKAGEDYMPGMKTVGEDNVLKLVVRVR
ncbi:MAG TPA: hypothetical protein VGJ25_13795 [Gaiellaceae bacterium]|jgi:hypothetical protein